jgi:hypothetical protein
VLNAIHMCSTCQGKDIVQLPAGAVALNGIERWTPGRYMGPSVHLILKFGSVEGPFFAPAISFFSHSHHQSSIAPVELLIRCSINMLISLALTAGA